MTDPESGLGEVTAGVWTAAAARAAGLSRQAIRTRLESGEWQRLRPRTYTYGGVVPDARMRASAAVQSASTPRRRAIAAGRTAARLWGLPLVDDHDPATQRFEHVYDDVALDFGQTTARTLTSRRLTLGPGDICVQQGVPTLSLVRTVVDLAAVLRPDALVCAVDHVLHEGLLSAEGLSVAVADRAWCPGAGQLREAVAGSDGLAESPHETLTRLLLLPVLPGLRSQVRVSDSRGRVIARLDLGDPVLRLGVESDGAAFHRGRAAQDRRRDARTGWTVERCTWFETRREQDQLRARMLATAHRLAA